MPKLTLLSRISDGLPLAASMEDEKDHRELDGYKAQAKKLLKTMSNGAPARVSVESGQSVFHYINQDGVCYMCLTEKSYPKRSAAPAGPAARCQGGDRLLGHRGAADRALRGSLLPRAPADAARAAVCS